LQESKKSRQNEGTAVDFLRTLASKLPLQDPIHIPKKELLQCICEWQECKLEHAELKLEEWESRLRRTILVGDWAVIYNIFTEQLVIEKLPSDGQIARAIELRANNMDASLRETLEALTPGEFENLLAEVFSRVPWAKNVKVTQRSRDGGIDFVGRYVHEDADEVPLYGQAKHWQSKLDAPSVQGFIGSLSTHAKGKPIMGIIYCTSGFSADAESEVKNSPIMIIEYDAHKLIDLMLRYEVGVTRTRIESFSLDGRFWDEIKE
jgi:restriction endonuclease Mrr